MNAVRVTAHLTHSFEMPNRWTPDLAGLLEHWWFREQLGASYYTHEWGDDEHAALPVGRDDRDGAWWWQCSSPIVPRDAEQYDQWVHRRFDVGAAVNGGIDPKVKSVLTAGGTYKSSRERHTMLLADRIDWQVIGDGDAIERLLRRCAYVGSGRARGNGEVRRWEVTPDGDAGLARFHRPLPVGFAHEHGIDGPQRMWRLVPPGWLGTGHVLCVMP